MLDSEESSTGSLVSGINLVDPGLDRCFAVPGKISDGLAGFGTEGLKSFAEVERSAKLDNAATLASRGKDPGMDVFPQAGYRLGDPVKGGVGSHVSSLVAEDPKREDGLIGPEGGGGMVDLPIGVDTNPMNGGANPANPVGETGFILALNLNLVLQGVDDLCGSVGDLFVDREGLLAGAVAALAEESFESGSADPEEFESEVGLGIEFRFESVGEVAERAAEVLPDVLEIGELHGDRNSVDWMVLAQFFLSTEGDVGGSLGERGDLVVTEIDVSFRKNDEGVPAFNQDLGRALHGFAVAPFSVNAEGPGPLHDPSLDPTTGENIIGGHKRRAYPEATGYLGHDLGVAMG